jgi:hypothetical protein
MVVLSTKELLIMIILFKIGGSDDFQLLSQTHEQAAFRKLLYNAKSLLNLRGFISAAKILSSIDFSLSDATNNFGDEFCVLHAEVPLDKYELIREQYSSTNTEDFVQIAKIFTELGIFLSYIVCDLKLVEAPNTKTSGLPLSELFILVNEYIGVQGGYLGDFTYRTHREFYPQYCDLDIDPDQYRGTTRTRFTTILKGSEASIQAKIIRGILKKYPIESEARRTKGLYEHFNSMATMLEGTTVVSSPDPVITSKVLRQTLDDVEALIRARSPTSCVDRIHTTLHSYLQAVCDAQGIAYEPDSSITHLFKTLRNEHPALTNLGPRTDDIEKILRAFASVMDALNPIRNRASAAHPNIEILGDDEALLVINVTRTLLHYLDSKFSSQ